jgi:nifR3 family TIM-barrel protein
MTLLPKGPHNCPYLILAPMEGVGDSYFRKAIASIGGFDEAVTEFYRVSSNCNVKSLAKSYNPNEISPIPLAAQIMGLDPRLMAAMAIELEAKGAHRIDLNFGCPSNTVNKKGAGSYVLKTPKLLYEITKAVVDSVKIPVTIKMRSGFSDTSNFIENLQAAEESGIKYLTLHPRTKVEAYKGRASWDLIAKAKEILKIPVVGNGDVLNVSDALKMLSHTNCDAIMIGRGALKCPFVFHEIKNHFAKKSCNPTKDDFYKFIQTYLQQLPENMLDIIKVNKMKQLLGFLFKGCGELRKHRQEMLRSTSKDLSFFKGFF